MSQMQSSQRPEEILQSNTDIEEWKLEVEKVSSHLKVTVRVDNRDWRTHLDQMHSYRYICWENQDPAQREKNIVTAVLTVLVAGQILPTCNWFRFTKLNSGIGNLIFSAFSFVCETLTNRFFFSFRKGIEEALTTTRVHLDKLHTDIARTLEKISSREKYLNGQLEAPLQEFRQLTDNLAATKEKYKQVREEKKYGKRNIMRVRNAICFCPIF